MNEIRKNVPALLVLLLILGFTQGALAQVDPPERVARLNFIDGAVSYLPSGGDENEWATAVMNRPLTAGDQLWADANSRGELHIGSTTMRINSNTGISFLNLDDTTVQIRLSDGSMNLRLRHLDPDETCESGIHAGPLMNHHFMNPNEPRFTMHTKTEHANLPIG